MKYRFAVLTLSDRCYAKEKEDLSGQLLKDLIQQNDEFDAVVAEYKVFPDDAFSIVCMLTEWCHEGIHCIITNGGTGFSERDVTPEATKDVIDKETPGLVHALIAGSMKSTPFAMLSRLTAGICKKTLIINFPGSPKACEECFAIIKPVLKHALETINNDINKIAATHEELQSDSKVKIDVANRDRQSSYEMISVDIAFRTIVLQINEYFRILDPNEYETMISPYDSDGLILARPVFGNVSLPPFDASSKDGYAVIAEDGSGIRTVLRKASVAGSEGLPKVEPGFCVRISTGAAIPPGANAVVQVEDTELIETTPDNEELKILIKSTPTVGQDIRPIGSDIKDLRLPRYSYLTPIELGLMASTGVRYVTVFRKIKISLLSTGDEIVEPGEKRPSNCIWDSNRALLKPLLSLSKFRLFDLGISSDNPDSLYTSLKRAFQLSDCLITTGGVSMGEKDLLKRVLKEDFGAKIHFGRVNVKPGKPFTFATCTFDESKKFIFSLPGNPVSAFVTFKLFVEPALDLLSGKHFTFTEEHHNLNSIRLLSAHKTIKCQIKMTEPYQLDSRPEFVRAIVSFNDQSVNDYPTVKLTEENQISSRLLNVKDANALVLFPKKDKNKKEIKDGFIVNAILF